MQEGSKKIRSIFLVSFLFFASFSIAVYVNSTALERFVDAQYTSLFYVFGAIGSLFFLFILPKILPRRGLVKTSLFIFMMLIAISIALGTTHNAILFTTLFVMYSALVNTVWYCIDLFIAHYTQKDTAGRTRGMYLTIINTAIAIMPAVAGIVVTNMGISSVYIIAAILLFIALVTIAVTQRTFVDRPYSQPSILDAWKAIRTYPSLRRVLSINFLLQFFYAWMTIFTPLYMAHVLHFSWTQIGGAFSFMLIPFVVLQYKVGTLADKWGEKNMLLFGLTFAGLSTLAFAFLGSHSIIAYALVLFCSRIGICMVEVLSESYFFKRVSDSDEGVVSVFRMMRPMAYIVAPLAGWYIIATTSYTVLFATLAGLLLLGTVYTLRLSNTN